MGKMAISGAMVALLCAAAPQIVWAACSNGTLNSAYSTSFSGFTNGNIPLAASAQLKFDGSGGISGSLTQSKGGTLSRGLSLTGSYSVNSNCTGFATLNISNGGHVHFDFQIRPNGKGFDGVQTDPSSSVTVTATRGAK